jgi:hypothetical protein
MNPLKEGKIKVTPSLIMPVNENKYFTKNQVRFENHKKIMGHLEAIAKYLDNQESSHKI